MNINKIAIIGLGLIGGSIAKGLKKRNPEIKISAFDKKENLKKAIVDKSIDIALKNIEDAIDNELIILSLPTDLSLKVFEKLIPLLNNNILVTDVCSVKGVFERTWQKLKVKGDYIGGHPMTGKEKGGYSNSDPFLFENAVYIISEKAKGNKNEVKLINLVRLLGSRIIYLDPFVHDSVVANVSHLPQLLAVSLLNTVSSKRKKINYLQFAAGGFKDLTRISSSGYNIWESILKFNKKEIIQTIKEFQVNLNLIKNNLEKNDFNTLRSFFENAKKSRESIADNKKGFLNPLYDLNIFINDEPGVLFGITKTLAEKNINIKDIELLKIRENVGGTFRLSFSTKKVLNEARTNLINAGFIINN